TVGIAVWLSRRITRPLGALATGTEELGRGNLDYRIAAQGRDEIGELVRHFNRMAGQLQEFQEKTIYLERMAAWQEIARRLAHEIKNPLTPIQLTIQEMVDQYRGEDADYAQLLRECHGIIHEEIENLRRLVREFSDFGRLPELHIQPGDLHQLIREVRALYPKQEIELELAENLPPLPIDEDRIRRVLINLIENALQADPGHHPITIRTRRREGRVEVEVEDRGSGMSAEVAEKIFQPYFTTKKKGVGLGLAITRKMVEEHGGRIAVHSTPGEGSRFVFELAEG
ncbi:MAG: HAMP domain-containing protein, partial [Calditrichaeota bacterium]|nr:HAMP domain-containing protein [Calditrichota bacterium]